MKALVLGTDDDAPAGTEDAAEITQIGIRPLEELDDVPQDDDVEERVGEGQPCGLVAIRLTEHDREPAPVRGPYRLP